jgi:hypothetical protein
MGIRVVAVLALLLSSVSCRTHPRVTGENDTFVPTPDRASETIALRWVEGAKLAWRVEERFEGKLGAGKGVSSRLLVVDATWRVASVDEEGSASIVLTVDRVRLEDAQPGRRSSFDTNETARADERTSHVMRLGRDLVGEKVHFGISSDGRVHGLATPKPMKDAAALARIGTVPRLLGAAGWGQALGSLALLPRETVAVDSRWTRSDEREMPYGRLGIDVDLVFRGRVERDEGFARRIDFSKQLRALDSVESDRKVANLVDGGANGTIYVGDDETTSFSLTQRGRITLDLRAFGSTGTQETKSSLVISLSP